MGRGTLGLRDSLGLGEGSSGFGMGKLLGWEEEVQGLGGSSWIGRGSSEAGGALGLGGENSGAGGAPWLGWGESFRLGGGSFGVGREKLWVIV